MTETKQVFSVDEVAAILGRSRRTIIRMFEKEPGVLVWNEPETVRKRRYRVLRIPRAVLERVILRLSRGGTVAVRFMKSLRSTGVE